MFYNKKKEVFYYSEAAEAYKLRSYNSTLITWTNPIVVIKEVEIVVSVVNKTVSVCGKYKHFTISLRALRLRY